MAGLSKWQSWWIVSSWVILGWWLYDLQSQWSALVEYQYGWLVAMLAAYLVWDRWPDKPRRDQPAPLWLFGLLVVLGTPFVLIAEFYKQAIFNSPAASFTLSIGCTLFLVANLLYGRGRATTRHLLFPLLFFYLAVPLPQIIWNPIVSGLQKIITKLDVETLNLLGIPAVQEAHTILLPQQGEVGIDEACSGVRSLQSSLMAALFLGALLFKSRSIRCGLLITGLLLALLGNYLRSLYLSLVVYYHGIEAVHQIHDTAGWSILIFTFAGLILAVWLARWMEKTSASLAPAKSGSAAAHG